MRALVSSGDGRAWPLITRQSEGSEVGIETRVEMETSGSGTSAKLEKLGQTKAERGRGVAEHLE